jgi:hypothetical protein
LYAELKACKVRISTYCQSQAFSISRGNFTSYAQVCDCRIVAFQLFANSTELAVVGRIRTDTTHVADAMDDCPFDVQQTGNTERGVFWDFWFGPGKNDRIVALRAR